MVLVEEKSRLQRSGKAQAMLDSLRCHHCNRLLGRISPAPGTTIEIKCHKCGAINRVYFASHESTANGDTI